jgi:hypothetical protein
MRPALHANPDDIDRLSNDLLTDAPVFFRDAPASTSSHERCSRCLPGSRTAIVRSVSGARLRHG